MMECGQGDNAGNPQPATVTDGMPEPPAIDGADQNQMEVPDGVMVPDVGEADNRPGPAGSEE